MSERKAYGATAQWLKAEIAAFPGRTAYALARELYAHDPEYCARYGSVRSVAATVSGILHRLVKRGVIRRMSENPKGPWGYYPIRTFGAIAP